MSVFASSRQARPFESGKIRSDLSPLPFLALNRATFLHRTPFSVLFFIPSPLSSSETLQLQRLQTRNSLSVADARARLSSQAPLSSKLVYADYVIDNSGPKADLDAQVYRVIAKLQEKAGWSWWLSWLLPPVGVLRGVLRVGWRLWVQGVGKERRTKHGTRGEKKVEEIEMKDRRGRNGSGRL